MKYWLITTEFPPIHGGGISTYCYHTAKMLTSQGHELKIFIQDHSVQDFTEENLQGLGSLIRFNPERSSLKKCLGYEARLSMEFSNIVEQLIKRDGKPDYIETQDYLGIGYYLQQKSWMNYAHLKDIPIIVCMHAPSFLYLEFNQSPHYKLPTYWTGEMEKACIAMADLLISPSQYLIDVLKEKLDFPIDNAVKLFNPFELDDEPHEPKEYNEGELAFFGKLTPQKGCLEMFEYLKQMWDNGFDKRLKVIGGGSHFFYPKQMDMQDYIKNKYAAYIQKGLVVFEGNVPPHQLHDHLASAQLVIVPSIVDNLPYAVIEAMQLGKVVLASDCGGQKELVESGKNGYIFKHTFENFQKNLTKLLSLNRDEIHEIGKKAKATILGELNYSSIYEQKISLLKNISKRERIFPFTGITLMPEKLYSLDGQAKLSVVIPFYNLGDTIEQSIQSILKSSYKNIEIIVVNDGSDNLASIKKLKELENKYELKILHKINSGLADSRNFGAQAASGDYLAFLDADDTVEPEYFAKAIKLLSSYENLHFVGCWAQYFGESNDIWPAFNPEPPYLLYHNMINSSALVYKKESFLKFGLNKKKMLYGMEDYESLINMVKNGARGVALPEVLWNYRIRKNSMQQSFNTNKRQYLYSLIVGEHRKFFNLYGAELSKLLNYNGPGYMMENPSIGNVKDKLLDLVPQKIMNIVKKNTVLRMFGRIAYKILNNKKWD